MKTILSLCAGLCCLAQADTAGPADARLRLDALTPSIHPHFRQQLAAELAEFLVGP